MLKKLLSLACLLFLFSLVNGEIQLYEPVEERALNGSLIEVGKISPGETIEFIFSVESVGELNWGKAEVEKGFLPSGWQEFPSTLYGKTIGLKLMVSPEETEGTKNIRIKLLNEEIPSSAEYFDAVFNVRKNLLFANIQNLKQSTVVGEPVSYTVTIFNQSIADHYVEIGSTLPTYWMEKKDVLVEAGKTNSFELTVLPQTVGGAGNTKEFRFIITSKLNDSELESFDSALTIQPTIKNKFSSTHYGFPFFSLTLLPYYLINSFIALLFP